MVWNKLAGIGIGIVDVLWLYLGYWLLKALMLLPEWIANIIGAPALALKVITLLILFGYVVLWLVAAIWIAYFALVVAFD